MRDIGDDILRPRLPQCRRRIAQRTRRIDDIVDQDAEAAFDVADDVHHFRFAGTLATLVDDRQRGIVESLGELARTHDAADVGRDDHQVATLEARMDVRAHHGCGIEIVGRDIEEALDLPGVQIDRQHAVGAGDGDQIGDELGRDGRAWPWFPILARIAHIGDDCRDALGRRALQRIDDDQQLHQIVVRRETGRLEHEHVLAAHILLDFDEDLLIGEPADQRVGQRAFEIVRDRLRERKVRIAGDQFHALGSLAPPFIVDGAIRKPLRFARPRR